MNKKELLNKVTRTYHKAGFKVKKHAPEIMVVGGVIGIGVGVVKACQATLKVDEIAEESKAKVEKIHTAMEKGVTEAGETYTEEDGKKDLSITYIQTGFKFAKLYAPSAGILLLSTGAILMSHNILSKRNATLAAAYTAVDKSFKGYRERVIERFGEEMDRELKYNIKTKEFEETEVDAKGKEKTVKKPVDIAGPKLYSPLAVFFDESCRGFEKDPHYNKMLVLNVQKWANDKLQSDGYLFWNDVLAELGIPKMAQGQRKGWLYYPDGENPNGDNYVDLGVFNGNIEANRRFVNGYEKVIILDPNVDDVDIWDKI